MHSGRRRTDRADRACAEEKKGGGEVEELLASLMVLAKEEKKKGGGEREGVRVYHSRRCLISLDYVSREEEKGGE